MKRLVTCLWCFLPLETASNHEFSSYLLWQTTLDKVLLQIIHNTLDKGVMQIICLLQPNAGVNSSAYCNSSLEGNTIFKGNICGPIAASMNESMFLLVMSRWRDTFDGLKETKDYKFLAAAGSLLKAMVMQLCIQLLLKLVDQIRKYCRKPNANNSLNLSK